MSKFHKVAIVIIATALLFAFVFLQKEKPSEEQRNSNNNPVLQLSAIVVTPKNIILSNDLPGRVTAYKISEIRPQVTGIILKQLFTEGSFIQAGDPLYQIDPSIYKAAYEKAKSDLAKSKAVAESVAAKAMRYEILIKTSAISKQEYDDIIAELKEKQADIAISQAAVMEAEINLTFTKVLAPISGRIGKSNVTEGALVTRNQDLSLATITTLDPIYVDISQPSNQTVEMLKEDNNYHDFSVLLYPYKNDTPYSSPGELKLHEFIVDQSTDTVKLRSLFPNPNFKLLPGLFVRTKLQRKQDNILLIPQYVTTRQADGSLSVWQLKDGLANSVTITTNGEHEGNWIISSGLEPGDIILTEGFMKLRPGIQVEGKLSLSNTQSAE